MEKRICAVVVTYNRKELLVRTLNALLKQTEPMDITIIDNASIDGTHDFLVKEGFFSETNIYYHREDTNTGGAGGFYSGIKLAYDKGYEWVWLMDDDGYPEENNCLESLLLASESFDVFGPLVLSDKGNQETSFPFGVRNHSGIIRNKEQAINVSNKTDKFDYILDVLCPFNGILLSKDVIERVGFPDPRLFIWGDEINYWMRCEKLNFRIATITTSTFLHPKADNNSIKTMFGKKYFNDAPSPLKLYCYCRNHIYNVKNMKGTKAVLTFSFKVLWFYSFTKPSLKKLSLSVIALKDGYIEDFSKHKKFIGKIFK